MKGISNFCPVKYLFCNGTMFTFWDTSSFWHCCGPELSIIIFGILADPPQGMCFDYRHLLGPYCALWERITCLIFQLLLLSKCSSSKTWVSPGPIQMMLLRTIPRKNVFLLLCENGFGLKLYSVPSLAWDNWVVLYQGSQHQKGRSLIVWPNREGIFLKSPTREKVTIGRDHPELLVASLRKSKSSRHPRERQMPSSHNYWWRRM